MCSHVLTCMFVSCTYIGRRHTLSHHSRSSDPNTYTETKADIQWALNRVAEEGVAKQDRTGYKEKQITVYHSVSGQIIEATGLKGELGQYY